MSEFLLKSEPIVRLSAFVAVFVIMALWEVLAPRRQQSIGRATRWPSNLGVVFIDTLLARILFPATAVGLALLAEARGFGLFNAWPLSNWIAIIGSVVVLDLVIYLQHVLFHAVPALWRLHRMHHADLEFDLTTGARFHPIEILLSMLIKLTVIGALGAPAVAVLIFEVLLNATAMFNHSNVRLPKPADRILRWLLVTPDMHRVHHSVVVRETNSNFGFNLPWWDRLFGTYRAQPEAGHDGMTIGVNNIRDPAEQRLDRMLTQPFRLGDNSYALGVRERVESRTSTESKFMTERKPPPILADKHYEEDSAFVPANLLREARRQKGLANRLVPHVCVLDPDGDIVRQGRTAGRTVRDPDWACYHTDLYRLTHDDIELGIVPCAVGAPFAVLIAEQLFASGCRLLISMTSSGQLVELRPPPYFVLIERALRDEGTSYHYLRPSEFSEGPPKLLASLEGAFDGLSVPVIRGATWTTDAPFRETPTAIAAMKATGLHAVEMEAAALYAFARAGERVVLCFAHVTNKMAQVEGDFEKGEADGSIDALAVIGAAARAVMP